MPALRNSRVGSSGAPANWRPRSAVSLSKNWEFGGFRRFHRRGVPGVVKQATVRESSGFRAGNCSIQPFGPAGYNQSSNNINPSGRQQTWATAFQDLRTGDAGTTGLGNGNRVSKTACASTPARWTKPTPPSGSCCLPDDVSALLTNVQHDLSIWAVRCAFQHGNDHRQTSAISWKTSWTDSMMIWNPEGLHPSRRQHPAAALSQARPSADGPSNDGCAGAE